MLDREGDRGVSRRSVRHARSVPNVPGGGTQTGASDLSGHGTNSDG
jgi:hypothetical protein